MNYLELINERHSVRKYLDKEIELEKIELINQKVRPIAQTYMRLLNSSFLSP